MPQRRHLAHGLAGVLASALLVLPASPGADAAGPVPAAVTVAAPAPAASKAVVLKPALKRVLKRVNAARTKRGLKPLSAGRCLTRKFAQPWARHMAHTGSFGHQDTSKIFTQCSGFHIVGENIAAGQPTAKAVMAAWMGSPDHKRNILRKRFKRIGLGLARDADGVKYWVQDFGG
ncbi:MAG: CAP domain-containing protein [Nocardioides sp.]